MGLLVVNSDFERLWNEPYPTISFDNTSYSLAGEVGTELSASFAIFDNYDADVTEQCEITFDNDYVSIEEGMFVCDDLEVGTYQTIATATYSYKSATVTATATINISVEEEQATSISFDSAEYSFTGKERETLEANFSVDDNLGNDITNLCSYSFSPNDKGVVADFGSFNVESAVSGQYNVTVTATYGQLTTTATLVFDIEDLAETMSFDSNSYTISGTEGDTITQAFTVTDDKGNDLTSECEYTLSPDNTGLTISNGEFDASNVPEGTYSVTVTATYLQGEGAYDLQLDAQATISMEIDPAVIDYSTQYLTFEALESGTFSLNIPNNIDTTYMTSVSYSTDNGVTWTTTQVDNTNQTITTPTINAGDKVLWKGEGSAMATNGNSSTSNFRSTGNYKCYGNIMSLLYGDNFANQTSFPTGSSANFYNLFSGINNRIVNAENLVLPATTLTEGCYKSMFSGCTSLTTAPALPATTLAAYCYQSMFENCHLSTAPALPSTTLANYCYQSMFSGCTSLTTAPALPATTLAAYCYQSMFSGCTSLTTAPALNATTLTEGCYQSMFSGCTSLTTAPALPSTTMNYMSYQSMFSGCTALTAAPALPSTTLANYCYQSMFSGCTSLTTAPALQATINSTYHASCYENMFYGCTSLTTAPALPSGTLANDCYSRMFYGCTALTTAPTLPAPTLRIRCYKEMFNGCTNINSITMLATDISATDSLSNWVNGVAAEGTFTKDASMTTLPSGASGIPENWTVVDA